MSAWVFSCASVYLVLFISTLIFLSHCLLVCQSMGTVVDQCSLFIIWFDIMSVSVQYLYVFMYHVIYKYWVVSGKQSWDKTFV